jgi:hypothetical protein
MEVQIFLSVPVGLCGCEMWSLSSEGRANSMEQYTSWEDDLQFSLSKYFSPFRLLCNPKSR